MQIDMFEESRRNESRLISKFQNSMLLSAVGDSLGWPLEFKKRNGVSNLRDFLKWKKLVGGKWWGYVDTIGAGEYSDDTQLTLSVARSIDHEGNFRPDYFAYLELPLWLHYERGGGRSIKAAARNILKRRSTWWSNFYRTKEIEYSQAGANGVSMRNLPIALVNLNNETQFVNDTFRNAIVTHGHPRAIVGALLIGGAQIYLLKHENIQVTEIVKFLKDLISRADAVAMANDDISGWLKMRIKLSPFQKEMEQTLGETRLFLDKLEDYLNKGDEQYYELTKAFDIGFKGSGTSTAMVGLYLAMKYLMDPEQALFVAVNALGSDTDTIAGFVGSLIGAYYGDSVPSERLKDLASRIQDKRYLMSVARALWQAIFDKPMLKQSKALGKTESLLRIIAWEIGLHELFWEALEEGSIVIHPTLGRGEIQGKILKQMQRDDYQAKIVKIKFDIGQTTYFHSRVSKFGALGESLSREVEKELMSTK
jgi:ADP-ribosylglycohydrolase